MGWAKHAFWFLIFILVLAWLVWFFGNRAHTEKTPPPAKETSRATTTFFGKDWFSGGLVSVSTTTTNDDNKTSFFKENVSLYAAFGAGESNPNREFIEIKASPWNKEIVVVSGWSLKTPSGKTIRIGTADDTPLRGEVKKEGPIALEPGDRLIVVTGRSPLGVSFRENICSGYLEQFQNFSPPIISSCPSPSVDIAYRNLSVESECVAFVAGIERCETPLTGFPGNLSAQCLSFVQRDLTYNGCVAIHQNDLFFYKDVWRFYAGENKELWNNAGGVIRLYDTGGNLVDSLTY